MDEKKTELEVVALLHKMCGELYFFADVLFEAKENGVCLKSSEREYQMMIDDMNEVASYLKARRINESYAESLASHELGKWLSGKWSTYSEYFDTI